MPDRRTAHPYYTYDAIQSQPAVVEKVLAQRDAIHRAAEAVAAKQRIFFVGIGTSLHAAQIASSWMREFTGGRLLAHFEQPFELLHHPIALSQGDAVIVITHTGTSTASVQALAIARAAGALTVSITGQNAGEGARVADFQIETCEQEVSFAYTKSYTAALAAIAHMAIHVAHRQKLLSLANAAVELDRVPALLREALQLEPQVRELAARVAALPRIVLFGAGLGWLTAREAALKIKESCYIAAEGFETEEVLHGPFSELDSRAALVGILSGRPSDDRARQILRAAGEVRASGFVDTNPDGKMIRIVVTPPSANHDISADQVLVVPEVPEWLSAFVQLVPLQLLSYFIALARGLNPDTGRQDQPAHAAASKHYKY
jgi:glucosamine--fructose-6-phosphate aminotransferase (isomerizing)